MNSIMENVKISLLYQIKTDDAQNLILDKIDFLNKNTQLFFDTIKKDQILQVKGLFGTHHEVEREVEQEINIKVNLQSYINHSEKGNLIAINLQNQMLFCLILSEKFFINKPINEKAIEIVLFRILQDLTDNIKFCLNDTILKENWYLGDLIPFSTQMLQRNDYDFAEEQQKEVKLYDCKWILSQDLSSHQIINSQTLSSKLTAIQSISFGKDEEIKFLNSYDEFTQKLFIQILSTQNKQINNLITIIKREYQIKNIIDILNQLSNELEKEVKNIRLNLFKQFFSKESAHLNDIWQTVSYQNKQFYFNLSNPHQDNDFQNNINKFLQQVTENFHKIQDQFKHKVNQIIEELQKQTYYEIQSVSLKLSRFDGNPSGLVEEIMQNEFEKMVLNSELISRQISSKFDITDVFDTKEKSKIYIIRSYLNENPKNPSKTYIFFQSHKANQLKQIKQFDLKDTENSNYFHDYNRGHLYIFNFKGKYVYQIIIEEPGTIKNEQNICDQHQNNKYFVISQVAYLNYCNKFIVLSKENEVYKQLDEGQNFQKVKCVLQIENKTKETEFIPSIKPEQKYVQLLTCPSGKYFYLANNYCCDRYDQNCMRIQSIEIEGPIKIFADNYDVIILCELNKKEQCQKQTKIISNLVSYKRFNKQENNEKKVIGNPLLDIVKGSFIKFGPNSQFLLKEKKRNINIYVNKDYYDQMEHYFNIMDANEIILSSSMFQFEEFKSEQIKNVIFSRVPLQLCTIEDSNLIPLNDGFRQQSQTQTMISVDQKVKQLHLGFLEDYLSNYNKKIFVVGIIGKQSSGKSYLLNRVFGTRFSVSSARCTDGVWGSIAYENDQIFLVLDCEGLFNGARTDKEEIKMLAFITAICDITILNSDLTFNRHFNDLFNHLVEASKQLKGDKIFQGILYFVIRDVSSTDYSGAEPELLKNLERLKERGSEDIIFLKRLFNNKISIEKLVNYENKQFDQQIIKVRKYFLDNFSKSNRWEDGKELILMMKILLCQLELSDNTNANLIELQIRIEKIFEESKELWDEFTLNEVKCQNLKLIPSKYKFGISQDHYYLLFNKNLLKQLYEDLQIEDSISNHNKNIQEVRSQFNLMLEFRKEQIISRTQKEICSMDNQEVQIVIKKNMSMLQSFLIDQMKQYEFCLEKCNQCHLYCKQFKGHIEIFQNLKQLLDDQIKNLENQLDNLQIKSEEQVKETRKRISDIEKGIEEAEYKLKGYKTYYKVNKIKEKQNKAKTAMMNYEFYNKNDGCLNLTIFGIDQNNIKQTQSASLDYIKEFQDKIIKTIQEFESKIIQNKEIINQSKIQIENYDKDQGNKEQLINQTKITSENQQKEMKQLNEQQLKKNTDFENIQSQINEEDIHTVSQVYIEQETQNLNQISNQLKEYQQKEQEKTVELQSLQQTDYNLYFDKLKKEIKEYEQQSNQLDEEIKNLKNQKIDLEDLRDKIKNEKSKKFGQNQKKIEEFTQQLNGINEQEINNQLNQCQLRKENLVQLQNFKLYKDCCEQIDIEEQNIQIGKQEISQQEIIIQGDIQNSKIQEIQEMVYSKNEKVINLFLKRKKEQLIQIQNQRISKEEEIQDIKNSIEEYNNQKKFVKTTLFFSIKQKFFNIINQNSIKQQHQNIVNITKLLDTQKRLKSEISDIQKRKQELVNKQQETTLELNTQEQILQKIIRKKEQLILENKNLQKKNIQIDQDINQLKSQLDQIIQFSEYFYEYKIQSEILKEKQIELEKVYKFESYKDLEQQQVQTQIEQVQNKINQFQQEKEQLMNQLQTFNQSETNAQNLRNLKDTQKNLIESELDVHLCQRESHKCDQVCQVCPDKICDNKAGHDKQQEHLCNKQDHRCNDKCQIIQCQSNCIKSFKHDGKHNCLNDHPCKENCQFCKKQCKKDRSNPHDTTHDCLDNYCTHNCKLCPRKCEKPHKHSLEKDNHFCESVHYCQELCQEEGICKIEYEVIQETWKTKLSEFLYTKYTPKDYGKQKCTKQIPMKMIIHEGNHCCKEKTEKQFHLCNKQCPECNTYCDQQYGHQGLHSSERHRNKVNQIFTSPIGNGSCIQIEDLKEFRLRHYQIGESSAPETCDQSCKRRGRAHYHLIRCKGGKKCQEKKGLFKARHSNKKYVNFETKKFDEILCEDFWKLKQWVHPIYNELETINKCNYYCPFCQQQNRPYSFCNQYAWHTQDENISDHNFSCTEFHMKNQIQGINIAFVIDTTGSMQPYIDKCESIVKDIIQRAQSKKNIYNEEFDISFAVVSYTDHSPYCENSEQILNIQDFSSEDIGGGDDFAEAVLDGLNASIKLNWNENYEKLLYLITDAPPHGKRYHNSNDNYPKGCPCGLKQENILPILQVLKVKFKILKLNQQIDMMITEFKKDFSDLVVFTPDLEDEDDFQDIIVNDVCQCLINNEITYQMQK